MKKGREFKKRMAALLIASMTAGSMVTPALAEPIPTEGDTGITVSRVLDWGSEGKVTIFCANGQDATIFEKDGTTFMSVGDETVELKKATGSNAVAVYAGSWDDSSVTDPVTLTMESGKVDYLLGGSPGVTETGVLADFTLQESTINMKGGTVRDVMANRPGKNVPVFSDCGRYVVENCTINLSGGTVTGQVGGAFSCTQVNKLTVNVAGGTVAGVDGIELGGTNGHTLEANLSMTEGNVCNISAGIRTLVDEATISVTGGKVGEIYAGSYYPDEETSKGDKTTANEKPWDDWSYDSVCYGIAKNLQITVSGDATYKGIYGGFQHGIKTDDGFGDEMELFQTTYAEKLPSAITGAYDFSDHGEVVINYSVEPENPTTFIRTRNLLVEAERPESVTVNKYTDASLTVDPASATMKLGEEKALTATLEGAIASPSNASPSEADYAWESTDDEIVSVTPTGEDSRVMLEAMKPGSAAVKVSYKGILEASCNVTVSEPKMSATLPSKMNYADEDTWLRAKVENIADELEVTYDASADKPGLSCVEDDDGIFNMVPEYGLSGNYEVTVTAYIDVSGEEYPFETVKTLTVNKPKFALKAADGSSTSLDAKGAETADLEAVGDYDGYDTYEWSLEGDAVELDPSNSTAKVTAVKEGTATVRVKAMANSIEKNAPYTGTTEIPAAEAEAKITIKVSDSREFKADKSYVELDINPEAAKLSETVKITNDYGDTLRAEVVKNTQPITAKLENGTLTVSTTAEEPGSATVVITRENGDAITIPVIVKTTAIVAEVKNGIEVEVKDDAVSAPDVKEEGLTEEQKAEAKIKTAEQAEALKDAITEVFDLIASDEKVAEELASNTTGMAEAAMAYTTDNGLKVENGDIVKVYPKQELKNVALDSTVSVNEETGEVTTTTVIKKMTFDISLKMDKLDENDTVVAGGTLNVPKTNTKPITFPIPLPQEGISPSMHYVKVTHAGDVNYFPIRDSGGVRYTVITTYHFSPFELEFVEEVPTVHHSSGRSGGSSYTTGKWLQTALGWQYKNSRGIQVNNCWQQLLWNNQMQWYHFDVAGYMTAGWYTDVDGNRYFLHNISDGNQGRMYTAWNLIEGHWYYFRENEGGPKGSLLINGITPDGHQTDSTGACPTYQPK